jgi:hypothetical protein
MAETARVSGFVSGADNVQRARAGRRRQLEIAAENEIEIKGLVAGFIADLGRPATPADKIAAEVIAATAVRARRLRSNGRDDAKERRQLVALMRDWPPSSRPQPEPDQRRF